VLLLVLILVLIAFGLLVVALLSGGVLWAWVSVGVSVAAAAVLLVDWLQRRSAVRAGAEAGSASGPLAVPPPPPPHGLVREPAVEPATEVIPTLPAAAAYGGAAQADATEAASGRRDERPDTRETVVLRALAPSGSAEGPSGAPGGTAPSRPNSSQSVTISGDGHAAGNQADAAGGAREGDPIDGASPGTDPDSEATVKVTGAGSGQDQPPVQAAVVPLRGGMAEPPAAPPGGGAAGGSPDLAPLGPDGAPPEEPRDAEAAGLVAELEDEVLVVDELPRYHLGGCRSLVGRPVIPLPAREAVELGFTPCAWCTPDRALTSRRRAPAR
jgi:hypothetical protein